MLRFFDWAQSSSSFTDAELQSRRCPPGYALKDSPFSQRFYKTCECDTSNRDILECNGADILISVCMKRVLGYTVS